MPKLTSKMAKEVKKAASDGNRTPLPEGAYVVTLTSCKVAPKEGPSGPYWIAEFAIPKGYDHAGRKFWTNLSLSEAARFKVAEFFSAFGDDTCTADTSDFVGERCVALIGQETQQQGKGAGELRNVINKLKPLEEEDDEDEDDSDDDDDEDEDEDDEDDI